MPCWKCPHEWLMFTAVSCLSPVNTQTLTTKERCTQISSSFKKIYQRLAAQGHSNQCFFIHLKITINKLQTNKLLYNTTRAISEGAKHYPLAFEVPLSSRTKSNSQFVHSFCHINHLRFRLEEYLVKNLHTISKRE